MHNAIKQRVYHANMELTNKGMVTYTWGNVSEIDRGSGLVVIKPSGVPYDRMSPEDMVVVALDTGKVVEGRHTPSSDTPTHLELYRAFSQIGGVAHTHSLHAVAFAQAGRPIPALGTTHADYFYGDIPCTRELSQKEVARGYEVHTGKVIAQTIRDGGYSPLDIPGILVKNHGPFTWGTDAGQSVYHAVVLERIAEMSLRTMQLNPDSAMPHYILDKHYRRKHGPDAYYGQR